jgi:hypothetical protein
MDRKARVLALLTVTVGLGLPLHAEVVAAFANQVRADLAVLASEPTLKAWQTSKFAEALLAQRPPLLA